MKQKVITGIFIFALIIQMCMFSSCSQQSRQGTFDDEVLTLTEIPEDKLMLTMRMTDGMDYDTIEHVIETQFPNVDIVIRSNTSLDQSVTHHDTEDIILMAGGTFRMMDLKSAFIDLSSEVYV